MEHPTEIRNRQHIRQVKLFDGLRWGALAPTDVDAFLDFGDRVFVFIEAKRGRSALPCGQRLALERLCDACQTPLRYCIVFHVEHDEPEADIALGDCRVVKYYHGGKWGAPKNEIRLKAAIDAVRAHCGL